MIKNKKPRTKLRPRFFSSKNNMHCKLRVLPLQANADEKNFLLIYIYAPDNVSSLNTAEA